eukprot:6155635-Lingulodinium_polyedra.AAC.1
MDREQSSRSAKTPRSQRGARAGSRPSRISRSGLATGRAESTSGSRACPANPTAVGAGRRAKTLLGPGGRPCRRRADDRPCARAD